MIEDNDSNLGNSVLDTSSGVINAAQNINNGVKNLNERFSNESNKNNNQNTDSNKSQNANGNKAQNNNSSSAKSIGNQSSNKINTGGPNGSNNLSSLNNSAKDRAKDGVKQGAKNLSKEGAKAGARAASAASTGGAAEVAFQASDKIMKGINAFANPDGSNNYSLPIFIFAGIAVFMFIPFYLSTFISMTMPSQVVSLLTNQMTATTSKSSGLIASLSDILKKFSLTDDTEMGEYINNIPFKDSIQQNIDMCKKYVDKSYEYEIETILREYCSENDYDYDMSAEKTKEAYPKETIVNSYNYTYLISIAGQTVENTLEKFTVNDYKQYFKSNYKLLLQGQEKYHDEGTVKNALGGSSTIKYCVFEISGVSIDKMYEIFKISPNEKNPTFDNATNSDILPYTTYLFKEWAEQAGIDVGSNDLPLDFANGYGSESIDSERLAELEKIFGDLSDAQQKIVTYAMGAVGCKYDQNRRMEEGFYDCSSLCARAYKTIGITMGGVAPTSANMAKYLVDHECEISTSYNPSVMQPGDLIFWKETYKPADLNSRFRKITHVAIYVGNGQMVSAASTKSGVVFKDVKTSSSIVSVSRPLYLKGE